MRIVAALPVVLTLLHTPPGGAVFPSGLSAVAQSAAEVETALELDRPARRLIQQGLRNEGFDPGTPDGLFGPRTRGAIRAWQAARGQAATGYLDGAQAELLRVAAAGDVPVLPPPAATVAAAPVAAEDVAEPPAEAPVPSDPGDAPEVSPPTGDAPAEPAPAPERCDEWTTRAFLRSATAAEVSACLAAGADVDARDPDGLTPLHLALLVNDSPEVVRILLAAGAALDAVDNRGQTLFQYAMVAAINATVVGPLVEALLSAGTSATARGPGDSTHLHYVAAGHADPAATETLIAAGADVGAQDNVGWTPLHVAARFNENPAVVEVLLAAGADVAARDEGGDTPCTGRPGPTRIRRLSKSC